LNEQATIAVEVGAVVRFRDRVWRVDATQDGIFTATPLDGRDLHPRRFAIALEQVTDGSIPFPDPSDTGDPADQDLLLRAWQLALIHGTAPIVGLQRSRAIPTPFQLVPLLMTLGKERVRLLIADDVGLGKTIEAGLILAELIARARVRRVLVVAPHNLREQWSDALEHFFHLDGTIVASELMPALERSLLPGQSAWEANDICIASVDYLKFHLEVLQYGWDLAIIDEAHLCARPPASPGRDPAEKLRWRFAEHLAAGVDHLMLLTATPHSGRTDSFASLLQLLDPALATGEGEGARINRKPTREHVCQRRRRDVEEWYGTPEESPFPTRDQQELVIEPSKQKRQLLEALREYTDELDDRAEKAPLNGWVAAHLQKRALSSPEALRISVKRRLSRIEERLEEQGSAAREQEQAAIEVTDDLTGDGLSDEQRSERVDLSPTSLEPDKEVAYLQRVLEVAARVTAARDAKLKELRELVPRRAAAHTDARRVIVFTRYKDTLDYVAKHLKLEGFELFQIFGELSAAERSKRFAAFASSPRAVLVATDCISEGLNLQHAAAEVVHYELPWNPNRLEQRNGRVDRFGQREAEVGVRTLVLDDELDLAILERCVRRAQEIREELGYAPPFFAGGEAIRDLVRRHGRRRQLSLLEEPEAVEDFFDPELTKRLKEESFFGQSEVSLGQVDEVLTQSRTVTGSPERLQEFIQLALGLHGCALEPVEGPLFRLTGSHAALADVLDPEARLVFQAAATTAYPEADMIDLAHPLLRRLVDLVRDRAVGPAGPGRIAGRATAAVDEVTAVVHILARFVAEAEPPVVLEELVPLAFHPYGEAASGTDPAEILAAPPTAAAVTEGDVKDAAGSLIGSGALNQRIEAAMEQRVAAMRDRHATLEGHWSLGLSEVKPASWDPVALTVLFPGSET
jgi:superfamily II DNA or RNA helicase